MAAPSKALYAAATPKRESGQATQLSTALSNGTLAKGVRPPAGYIFLTNKDGSLTLTDNVGALKLLGKVAQNA